ncbi:MAG TPA: SAF domain-containing protein [Jatrophihabitans sp.]
MTASSPQPRRISTPSWLDLRLVLGAVLVLTSIAVGAVVVSRARDTHSAVIVTRDLAAGTVLTADDLAIRQVQLPGDGRGAYVATVGGAVHRELTRAVSQGELLPVAAIRAAPAGTTLTVPLDPGAAPDLRAGQRIEVWVSTPNCASTVLLPDVTVQTVHVDSGGAFSTGTGGQDVVISIDRALADRVVAALAIADVRLRAGILAGTDPAPASEPPAPLPDLTRCAQPSGAR